MIIIQVIFWLCIFLIVYSYLLYPLLLFIIHSFKRVVIKKYEIAEELPTVSILMAVRNEEKVIEEKLQSILQSDYALNKLEVIIGSDASDDTTEEIIKKYAALHPIIKLVRFETRSGKPFIINHLVEKATHDIIILTDANVMPETNCITNLVKPFIDERCGLTGANILNRVNNKQGIAGQEKFYIQFENKIKFLEGDSFGAMIGPFGGCYALRKNLYSKVPEGFAVDDFYIGMKVLQQGYSAILVKDAICYEDVSSETDIEFRRKRRIANGNFHNLGALKSMLMKPFSATGFCFISHKVIRWYGPVLWLTALICNLLLLQNQFYLNLLYLQLLIPAFMLLDTLLAAIGFTIKPLRYIAYFCSMNAALFFGLIDYLKGSNANVWEPTKRN